MARGILLDHQLCSDWTVMPSQSVTTPGEVVYDTGVCLNQENHFLNRSITCVLYSNKSSMNGHFLESLSYVEFPHCQCLTDLRVSAMCLRQGELYSIGR